MEKVLAVLAVGAAAVVFLAVEQANLSAEAGRKGLSNAWEQQAQRDGGQDGQVYADKVYLGEPPRDARGRPSEPGSPTGRVVVNASGLQIEDVWVADDSGRSISIRSAARCTMYALPAGFDAQHLYFTDPNGSWHRPLGGPLQKVALNAFPAPETDSGDPVWSAVLTGCAG